MGSAFHQLYGKTGCIVISRFFPVSAGGGGGFHWGITRGKGADLTATYLLLLLIIEGLIFF